MPPPEPAGLPGIVDEIAASLAREDAGGVLSIALVGSGAVGGLGPDSDLDLLVITRSSLADHQRERLVAFLLPLSGSRATAGPARPLEVTSLRLGDVVPWSYPATRDFQYGEWLRDDYLAGLVPAPTTDPNLPVLITSARADAIPLHGPPPSELLEPVPEQDLKASMYDALPSLVAGLRGDERNVLLTLARMVVTLESGRIVPKDVAAQAVAPSLQPADRAILTLAADAYRGRASDEWSHRRDAAEATAGRLARRITEQ